MTCKWNIAIHKVYAFVKPLYLFKIGNFLFQLLWYASLKAFGVAFWCHPVIFRFYIIKQTHDISNLACTHTHIYKEQNMCNSHTRWEMQKKMKWQDEESGGFIKIILQLCEYKKPNRSLSLLMCVLIINLTWHCRHMFVSSWLEFLF